MKKLLIMSLSCAIMIAATEAEADVLRVYDEEGMLTDVGMGRQTKIEQYNIPGYPEYRDGIVNYDDVNRVDDGFWGVWSGKAKRMEILRPETVGVEIDMPQSVPIRVEEGFCQKFTGRVYLKKGVDATKIVSGRLSIECDNYVADDYLFDEHTKFTSKSDNIVVTMTASEASDSKFVETYYLDYTLGGENGTEAFFGVELRSGLWSRLLSIRNITSANSFEDVIPILVETYRSNSTIFDPYSSSALVDMSSKALKYTLNCELMCNAYLKKFGVTSEIEISRLNVNGNDVPKQLWSGYVTCEPVVKSSQGKDSNLKLYFNTALLDRDTLSNIEVDVEVTRNKLNPGAPEWLENFCQSDKKVRLLSASTSFVPKKDLLTPKFVEFPDCEPTEGSVESLFDGNVDTFCHSAWSVATERSEPFGSYLDVEFENPVQEIGFIMKPRQHVNLRYPKEIHLYACNDGRSWEKLGEANVESRYNGRGLIADFWSADRWFKAEKPFKYLRWCVMKNNADQSLAVTDNMIYWNLAELRFYGK